MRAVAIIALASVLLSACAGTDETYNEPTELTDIEGTVKASRAWTRQVGDQLGEQRLGLQLAMNATRLFAASGEGQLTAIGSDDGSVVWQVSTELPISGGPGVSADYVVVGTRDGHVAAFSANDGSELWRKRIGAVVLAAPAVGDQRVIVRAINGTTYGLDARTGERIWTVSQDVPALTLRGNAGPILRAGIAVIGHDNGRVTALRADDGEPSWDHLVSEPSGRGELERLNDVDGAMAWVGADIYVVNYQGRLVSLNASSGGVNWVRDFSSYQGVTGDRTALFLTDATSEVWGLDRRSGASLWRQDDLKYRDLTAPAVVSGQVAVADLEGYIHFLDYDGGGFTGRVKHSSSPIRSDMISSGELLFALDVDGRLTAWRVSEH